MSEIGDLYTSATWIVKEGREADFVAAWRSFAEWTSRTMEGVGVGHLLQQVDQPRHFLSFGHWASQEAIQRWRGTPEFQEFLTRARLLCEEVRPRTLSLVALSS